MRRAKRKHPVITSLLACAAAVAGRASACTDVSFPLDRALAAPQSISDRYTRDTVLFMLRGLVSWEQSDAVRDSGDTVVVDCKALAPGLPSLVATLEGARDADGAL